MRSISPICHTHICYPVTIWNNCFVQEKIQLFTFTVQNMKNERKKAFNWNLSKTYLKGKVAFIRQIGKEKTLYSKKKTWAKIIRNVPTFFLIYNFLKPNKRTIQLILRKECWLVPFVTKLQSTNVYLIEIYETECFDTSISRGNY